VVKIIGGTHKGKVGKIAGELNADGIYPVLIAGKAYNVKSTYVEVRYGDA
jgi:hypothetical protein